MRNHPILDEVCILSHFHPYLDENVMSKSLLFMLHFAASWYDYVWLQHVEHSVTGTNDCIGANYCKVLI